LTAAVSDITGKLEALGLAPGHGVDRLSQPDVTQSHIGQGLQGGNDFFMILEKIQGLVHRHGQNVVNVLLPVVNLKHRGLKPCSFAIRTGDEYIRKKLHLYFFEAVAIAGFTAPAGHIKRKMTGPEFFGFGGGGIGQQPPNRIQGLGVGQGVGARGAPDGSLVHQYNVLDLIQSADTAVLAGAIQVVSQGPAGGLVKNFFGQGRFARSGYSG
jgi:hypothetical protein